MEMITEHAWVLESPLESSMMFPLMRHQSTVPETTMADALDPNVLLLDAQTVLYSDNALDYACGAMSSSSSNNNNNNNLSTFWAGSQYNSLDASVNSFITRDLEGLCDQELSDFSWADLPDNAGMGQTSDTIGSCQRNDTFPLVQPLATKTNLPQVFQCHHPSTRKGSEETLCGKSFTHKRGLTRHERNVHTSDGYKCRCGDHRVSRKDNHRRHVRSCDRIADPNQPIYICRCGVPDSDKDGHLRHLKTCTIRSGGAERQSDIGDGA